MAHAHPLAAPAAREQPQQHDRPRTSYPQHIQSFFRGATRKNSLNDLDHATSMQPAKRPRTGSEACISRPAYFATQAPMPTPDQLRTDSGLPSQSSSLQRSSTLRTRGSRRTRSSFGNWMSSLNDFRKEAGYKFRSRGHFSRKSVSMMDTSNPAVSAGDAPSNNDAADQKLHNAFSLLSLHAEGASIAGPRGRPLEHLPPHLDCAQSGARTLSPAGGAGARAAAAMLRSTEKPRQSSMRDSMDCEGLDRRSSNTSDTESGIEVDLSLTSSANLVSEPRIAGHDPAKLPAELFTKILTFLDAESLLRAESVSRAWNSAARTNHVWKHCFHDEYIVPAQQAIEKREYTPVGGLGLGKSSSPQEWKKMLKARRQLNKRWQDGHAAAIYLEGHTDSVYCTQFDERKVITGSRDWTVRIWDATTLKCTHVLGVAKEGAPAHSSLDTRKHHGQQPFVSLVPSGAPAEPIHIVNEERHVGSVLCMQYDQDIMVTGSSDSTLIVWSMKDYSVIKRLRHHRMGVLDVCFNDKYIVACSKDMNITVWSRETLELVKCLEGHRGPVNAVQMRANLVCSASGDGVAKLWDLNTGLCIKEFQTPQPAPDVRSRGLACIEFTKEGRILAGGNDRTIYQFNTVTGSLEHRYEGHDALVRSLHYDAANDRLVSGSYDHSVKAYDLKTQKLICDFKDWTTSWMLSAKSDYRRIVTTSQDARAVVIDFSFGLPNVQLLAGDDSN